MFLVCLVYHCSLSVIGSQLQLQAKWTNMKEKKTSISPFQLLQSIAARSEAKSGVTMNLDQKQITLS